METPGITTAPSARTVNSLAPKISPLLPESVLSDKNVQIDGLPHCSTTEAIFMDLWNSNVGLF
jgi:hypothetical protein